MSVYPDPYAMAAPASPYDYDSPEPSAPCGCPESECEPAVHEGQRYCVACGNDLPAEHGIGEGA